jgi:hypothetical protein
MFDDVINRLQMNYLHVSSLLLAALLFSSCEKDIDDAIIPTDQIDPVFIPYFFEFLDAYYERLPNAYVDTSAYTIQFAGQDELNSEHTIGKCSVIGGTDVIIAKPYWDSVDASIKRAIIFHELGHCILGRFHDAEILHYTICKSLMTSVITGSNCGIDYYSPMWHDFYLDELFGIRDAPEWLHIGQGYELPYSDIDSFRVTQAPSVIMYVEQTDSFQVELLFSEMKPIRVKFGRYTLDMYNEGSGGLNGRATIFLDGMPYIQFPFMNGFNWNATMKLTLRIQDGVFYFFLNEKLVHNREADIDNHSVIVQVQEGISPFEQMVGIRW